MRLLLRLFLMFLGFAGWIAASALALLLYSVIYNPWDDSISLANRHTSELLALHEKYDQTRQVVDWLDAYHGEAASHQVMISFVEWSLTHKDAIEALFSPSTTIPPGLSERIAFAASDSGLGCRFHTVFTKSVVPTIVEAVGRLQQSSGMDACG